MNRDIFLNGLKQLNIEITDGALEKFAEYSRLLKEWNEKLNLTAITDDEGISVKHFLDSALPLGFIRAEKGAKIIDVGTGAGFPGLPIKILREDVDLTLVDSLNKRVNFLNAVKDELGLENVSCIHARAEELGRKPGYREAYDLAVSRAVANMTVLCEYCLPYVKVGGKFIALKAENVEEELDQAKPTIGNLGGRVADTIAAKLPCSDIVRKLVVIEKIKSTPPAYPRTAKKINKNKINKK